jgi:cephalosporin hydroxylase
MGVNDFTSNDIPNDSQFNEMRELWRVNMGKSETLRNKSIELTVLSNEFSYGYQWEWCGVPIIRHPDDIVLQQEIIWNLKPKYVIETGIARGGSVVLSSSLLQVCVGGGQVLGIDVKILDHTTQKLRPWLDKNLIKIYECDSASDEAVAIAKNFLKDKASPALLILDSNHTHEHVLNELNNLAQLLPIGSIVIVADTIIAEMPSNFYSNRPWGVGNNPLTAVNKFLEENKSFKIDERWSRRSLMGEFRDGIIIKVAD